MKTLLLCSLGLMIVSVTGDGSVENTVESQDMHKSYEADPTCAGKLALMHQYADSSGKDPVLLEVPPSPGKKGGMSCARGKCCKKMPNPTEGRCNMAVRDVSSAARIRWWDYGMGQHGCGGFQGGCDGYIGYGRQRERSRKLKEPEVAVRNRKLLFGSLPNKNPEDYYFYYSYEGAGGAGRGSHGPSPKEYGKLWLCYWDAETETCKGTFKRFNLNKTAEEDACAMVTSTSTTYDPDIFDTWSPH